MARAILLSLFLVLAHSPILAGAGVYELPDYSLFCDETKLASRN